MSKSFKESLKEKKIEMKNYWENCFELKIEDKLTEEGLKKFWDENTSFKEAEEMLTYAAIDNLVGHLFDSLACEVIIGVGGCKEKEEHDEEPCNVKNGTPFKVVRTKDSFIYEDEFETKEAADEFIRNTAMHSALLTVDDFKIAKVYD